MADSLKTFFSKALVKRLAADFEQVAPAFPSAAFIRQASTGLEELELLDRGRHLAAALAAHLPKAYPEALKVLLSALGPEHATDELVGGGMAPFYYLPHVIFVAEQGLGHFEHSMLAQYELTKRFTAEFSIRPYIAQDPERTFRHLRLWTRDANPHVRRLTSEGTRLRLPWASRVAWLDAHPERVLELLESLKDDPTTLVRRSVANNLNDLGKVHGKLLLQTCKEWLKGASTERRALVEHALRSAVKRGEPGALQLLGYGEKPAIRIEDAKFVPQQVRVGGKVGVRFKVRNVARKPQDILVDLAVHFVKANGKCSPKVFKLKRLALESSASTTFETSISFAPMTTRRHYPGTHRVEAVVNGVPFPIGEFLVKA